MQLVNKSLSRLIINQSRLSYCECSLLQKADFQQMREILTQSLDNNFSDHGDDLIFSRAILNHLSLDWQFCLNAKLLVHVFEGIYAQYEYHGSQSEVYSYQPGCAFLTWARKAIRELYFLAHLETGHLMSFLNFFFKSQTLNKLRTYFPVINCDSLNYETVPTFISSSICCLFQSVDVFVSFFQVFLGKGRKARLMEDK